MPHRGADNRSNLRVRALMATTGEGLIAVDCAGTVRLMNEAAQEMLERTRPDVIGKPLSALGVPELEERLQRTIESRRNTAGKPFSIVVGEKHLGCRTQRFQTATECGVAVTLRDDTPLIRQQEESQAILASTGDGLILFSPDSRITFVNPAACDLLGCAERKLVGRVVTPDALLGLEAPDEPVKCNVMRNCTRIDCPAYDSDDYRCWLVSDTPGPDGARLTFAEKRTSCARCEVYERNSAALDGLGSQIYQEVTLNRPDPRIIKTRTNAVVDRNGHFIGMVLTLHDITAEREIAQMKNEFVSTVSHELRTPLTSIKGYVDLIIDGDAGEINEIQRDFLGIVKENADRLVALINDMLDISRIESGRVHLKVEPISVADSINGTVDSFKAVLDQSGRTVKTRVAANLPRVAADRDRVGQVLMNFVSNALKYSPEGGDVTISARRAGDFVNVSVQDHGMGISREDRRHLFTKFYRVDNQLTREIGGTGLGLSICKSVIELLGGRVWARSKPGEGSTFSFSLPIAPHDMVRTPYVQGPSAVGGKVLVVDRDPEIAALIETYLAKRGYEVVKAHSGAEALDVALREKPLVITLDVILDDADGFELLQELKDHPETESIPVVVLSIVCDEGRSCRLGAADYLEKPIDQTRLLRTIDGLVGTIASPLVLVVDDDRSTVKVLTDTLRSRGFAVAAAFNGREAIASIDKRKPDIILLDLKMPEMDGYQVIQYVKSHPGWEDIQIVVMTAHRIDRDRIEILKMAATQVAKPLSPDDIAERVEGLVRRRFGQLTPTESAAAKS